MPKITFIQVDGSERIIDAPVGLSIMEVAVRNAMDKIEGACGGSLACATCHVYVHPDWWDKVMPEDGEISEAEEDMLDLAFHLTKKITSFLPDHYPRRPGWLDTCPSRVETGLDLSIQPLDLKTSFRPEPE